MGEAYPELKEAEALLTETLKLEEARFRETLARGLKLLDEATLTMKPGDTLPGEVAFKLYDTFGFPRDLTEDALRERGMKVDIAGFDSAMARQKSEARKAWSGSGEAATDTLWFALREELGPTEFLGYDTESAEGAILAIMKTANRGRARRRGRDGAHPRQPDALLRRGRRPGGRSRRHVLFRQGTVISTPRRNLATLSFHVVEITRGNFQLGDAVDLRVDTERRRATRANHSATHLLHAALKHVLGPHVAQKGSLSLASTGQASISPIPRR